MKNKFLPILGLSLLLSTVSVLAAERALPASFTELLTKSGMVFQMPEGMVEAPVVPNDQMNYEYALKYPDKKFEIRYAIRPLADRMADYREKEKNKKDGEVFANPNS